MASEDPTPTADNVPPLADRLFKGSALMIAMRWFVRLLGVISTAILARLLTPDDFGVIGLAIILTGFVSSITDVGVVMALIQNTRAERKHYDSAWTIQIGQSTVVALVILLCAPFSGEYFGDDRVPAVLALTAASIVVEGFINIGIADFRKKLQFGRDFLFSAVSRFLRLVATIILAVVLRNYWAIAYGNLAGAAIDVALSYIMSAYRPRLSLAAVRELWSFSQWMLAINSIKFMLERGERFIIGRAISTEMFGFYSVGYDLASMPTIEVVMPIVRAVDASVALIKDEADRLRGALVNLFSAVMLFALPCALGFLMVSREFLIIVLGRPWLPALPIIKAAVIAATMEMMILVVQRVLIRADRIRTIGIITGLQMVVLLAAIYPIYSAFGLAAVIYGKAILSAVVLVIMAVILGRQAGISARSYFGAIIRPVLAAAAMVAVLQYVGGAEQWNVLAALLLKVGIGGTVYAGVILALWLMAGRPDGAERFLIDKAASMLTRRSD
ncbi:MAG TPA: oligosaccharide flippase family protein [Alphaproteobacteria bacterium]|nr:oligosaccharide flippase family protein [Alphaproteobacteria bacterium]